MITEKDMQYILTIANYGNLTKAADALFLSQPALSIHLKQLENSLGLQLFDRMGRKMILTYAGEEFVKSARSFFPKKDSGILRSCSAKEIRLTPLST